MKKLLKPIVIASSLLLLAACSDDDAKTKPEADEAKVTVSVKPQGKKAEEKVIIVDQDDSVLDALDEGFDVEEDQGFVTGINGVNQDTAKNIYWMYQVNGKMPSKGADQLTVKNGDKIEFYQEKAN